MNIITRMNSPLKKTFKGKNICKDLEKKRPVFYCWYGHTEDKINEGYFKYRIISKKKFSTVEISPVKIDMIGVGLVGIVSVVT